MRQKYRKKKLRNALKVRDDLKEAKDVNGEEAPRYRNQPSAPVNTEHKVEQNILMERRCNIQQQTFNDLRASTETFLSELN